MNPPKHERNIAIGRAYFAGTHIRLIALRFGVSESVVCEIARRFNLPKRYRTTKCPKSPSKNRQLELPLTFSPRT